MKVLTAMSGGVDSSVAAALLLEEGHDVVGVTMKLWGGVSDSGCCSVSDVEDARRVAQQLGIDHWVFNFSDEFDERVVAPYVADHAAGRTPNPCIECNRHLKFDRLLERARALGFDAVATGHHARVIARDGVYRLLRGADSAKDQSYVLYVLAQHQLASIRFPVGEMTKADVRARAAALGLRTAAKAESQDTCFVLASAGRRAFLSDRIPLHAGCVVDTSGDVVGAVDAVEWVTLGQRRGLGVAGGAPRYAVDVDTARAVVTVGEQHELLTDSVRLAGLTWVDGPVSGAVLVQCRAHGDAVPARVDGDTVRFEQPHTRVAPGQSVVLYRGDEVVGGGIAVRVPLP